MGVNKAKPPTGSEESAGPKGISKATTAAKFQV